MTNSLPVHPRSADPRIRTPPVARRSPTSSPPFHPTRPLVHAAYGQQSWAPPSYPAYGYGTASHRWHPPSAPNVVDHLVDRGLRRRTHPLGPGLLRLRRQDVVGSRQHPGIHEWRTDPADPRRGPRRHAWHVRHGHQRVLQRGTLPVTLKNKGDKRATFTVRVEAVTDSGERITDASVFANDLGPGQSYTDELSFFVGADKVRDLSHAKFNVVSVSTF